MFFHVKAKLRHDQNDTYIVSFQFRNSLILQNIILNVNADYKVIITEDKLLSALSDEISGRSSR